MKKRILIVFLTISFLLVASVLYVLVLPQRVSTHEIAAEVNVETSEITLSLDFVSSAKKYSGFHSSYDESSGILSISVDSSILLGEFLPKPIIIPNTYSAMTSIRLIGTDKSDFKVVWETKSSE